MTQKKVLIIANSVYQLLNAVHIKSSLLKDTDTELIVTDVTAELYSLIPNIERSALFSRVMFAYTKDISKKYAVGSQNEITDGFINSEKIIREALSDTLSDYSEIYFSNFDTFTRMLAVVYYFSSCDFICFEDGFSTYVIDFLKNGRAPVNQNSEGIKILNKLKKFLLYEPALAMRGDETPNERLPKIDTDDREFISLLNNIFNYKKPQNDADFIFLEQSFRAEGIKTNDIELMKLCRDAVGTSNFIVKPHPRNPQNVPLMLGLTPKYQDNVPWELYLLNEQDKNKTVITVCSNAALTSKIVFSKDINTVMLYELFSGKVLWKEDDVLREYLKRFYLLFASENYYVPKTVFEASNTLKYLGGLL